jgi:hypothetical protein
MKPTTTAIIRYATLIAGLGIAAFLTAKLLSYASQAEFMTELFTGSGWAFFVYITPYVLFTLSLKQETSVRRLTISAIGMVLLGLLMVRNALSISSVNPIDVPIFDPSLGLVAAQLAVVAVSVLFSKHDRTKKE